MPLSLRASRAWWSPVATPIARWPARAGAPAGGGRRPHRWGRRRRRGAFERRVFFPSSAGASPWLRLKLAASLDGRTAMASGESRWITGAEARRDVQRWRARSCVLLTGVGTVLADDPRTTLRPEALSELDDTDRAALAGRPHAGWCLTPAAHPAHGSAFSSPGVVLFHGPEADSVPAKAAGRRWSYPCSPKRT